jgi:hypothetical protein
MVDHKFSITESKGDINFVFSYKLGTIFYSYRNAGEKNKKLQTLVLKKLLTLKTI